AQQARDAESEKIAELTDALHSAKARVSTARAALRQAEHARDSARASRRLTEVTDQLHRIREASEAYATLLQSAPSPEVTDTDVRALEEADS
ncbi:hypothetical protein K4H04_22695, partial [Mycobacterium tuberculosis]|nr:hypothetical protein [Mycobacterium tuberculosis]